uniref:ATP synthase protein 8 n=1 Tax=Lecanora strobilina TaxID=1518595 RepID=A0A166AUJ6_9LECA|nr:ATP synthase F0 subunit 8 [Lecanora strobilina]AMZ84242.1 ATP synthase F0 subunit 8 [Lecanora strobilina]
MPQLVPFYFLNQITFVFILLIFMLYTFSKNTLPRFFRLFSTRNFTIQV